MPPSRSISPATPPKNQGPVITMAVITGIISVLCVWLIISNPGQSPEPAESVAEAPDTPAAPAQPAAPAPESTAEPTAKNPASEPEAEQPAPEPALAAATPPEDHASESAAPVAASSDDTSDDSPAVDYDSSDTGLFSDEEPLLLLGLQAASTASRERDAALLAKAVEHNAWDSYHLLLTTSLEKALRHVRDDLHRNGFDPLWQEEVFVHAFLRWSVLNRMPVNAIRSGDRDASPLLGWFMTDHDVMLEWLLAVKPENDLPSAVGILHDLWYGDPERFQAYATLAIACALVFDRELRVQHPPRSAGYDARVRIDPLERFLWFADRNDANRLAAPVDRMSARDLVWVVCAPVATEELDWAVANMRLRRNRWGQAFGMVEYLMERAVSNENPYEEYTFAEILEHGGVCRDQTYFCVNTARAHGIPAVGLSGETDLGPHAWAALKLRPDEWCTMTGRIGGTSDGRARHPQTRGHISEQEIWLWNEREFRDTATLAGVFRYHWIADLIAETTGDDALVESAVREANTRGRNVPDTWQRLHDLLATRTREAEDPGDRAIVDMWSRFVSEMKARFRDNPRMGALASRAEDEFIFPHIDQAEARRTHGLFI